VIASIQMHLTFVYQFKWVQQNNMFTNRPEKIKEPIGPAHLFEVVVHHLPRLHGTLKSQVIKETAPRSLCGKSRSEIGALISETEARPHSNICAECERIYKADPRSPWYNFVEGKAIKA